MSAGQLPRLHQQCRVYSGSLRSVLTPRDDVSKSVYFTLTTDSTDKSS